MNGQLCNLRRTKAHARTLGGKDTPQPSLVALGGLRKPRPEGLSGWLRFDSVRQRDQNKVKGVDHCNFMDEVTHYQFTGSVERISEHFLLPLPESLLEAFPFRDLHSDNGSECVNDRVAVLLEKLRVEDSPSREQWPAAQVLPPAGLHDVLSEAAVTAWRGTGSTSRRWTRWPASAGTTRRRRTVRDDSGPPSILDWKGLCVDCVQSHADEPVAVVDRAILRLI